MNERNLKPFTSDQSRAEAVKNGSKGGEASGEARRRRKELREAFSVLLESEFKDKKGNTLTGAEAIALKVFERALKGDLRAFEIIRDTTEGKPKYNARIEYNSDSSALEKLIKTLQDIARE